jgi:two-component system, sensor histidine kinase and response regulator
MRGDRDLCLATGMDDYLPKPFNMEQLISMLERHLRKIPSSPKDSANGEAGQHQTMTAEVEASPSVPIERSVLNGLRSFQQQGAPDIVGKVVNMYLSEASKLIEALDEAVQSRDVQEVYRVAHKLKSSSANVGALNLASLLRDAEAMGRQGSMKAAPDTFSKIRLEYEAGTRALQSETANEISEMA